MKRNNPSQNEKICGENNSESSKTWKSQHNVAKLMEDDPWISSVDLASHMAPPGSIPLNRFAENKLSSISNLPDYTMSVYEYMNVQQRCRGFEENGFRLRKNTRRMEHSVNQIVAKDIQSLSQFNRPVPLGSSSALPSTGSSSSTLMNSNNGLSYATTVRYENISLEKVVPKNKSEIEARFDTTTCSSHSDPNKAKQVMEDATRSKIEKTTEKALRTIFVHSKSRKDNKIEILLPHFKKFGEIIDITVPRGGHRSFIQFSNTEEAEKAIEAPDAAMGDRFKIKWSYRDNIPVDVPSSTNSVPFA